MIEQNATNTEKLGLEQLHTRIHLRNKNYYYKPTLCGHTCTQNSKYVRIFISENNPNRQKTRKNQVYNII